MAARVLKLNRQLKDGPTQLRMLLLVSKMMSTVRKVASVSLTVTPAAKHAI